jgi:hypothetical protein
MMVWYMIWMSAALPVVFAITWPRSEHVLQFAAVSILAWTYMVAPKICQVRREGETWLYRLRSVLIYPTGIMWTTLMLRPVRLYGIVTFLKQRWTTRQHGIEELTVPVGVHDLPPEAGVPALRPELEAVT